MLPTGYRMYSYHSMQSSHSTNRRSEFDYEDEGEHTESESFEHQNLLRTQLLMLDYKQFKAARIIQRNFRGWRVRKLLDKRQQAATLIQGTWRAYASKHSLIVSTQEKTQQTIEDLFDTCSRKIQALFRGWWSRKHINNMLYLKNMQLNSIEDLLKTMIYKLHTMKRTEDVPGLLEFRDKECLTIVEDLLSTMSYRFYNRYVGNKWITAKAILDSHRRSFADSNMYTWVPYSGYDDVSKCNPPPSWEQAAKIYDRHEYDIAQAFLADKRTSQEQKKQMRLKQAQLRKAEHIKMCSNQRRFCRDLINEMKDWKVCEEQNLVITDRLLGKGFDKFLRDFKNYLSSMNYLENCDCQRDTKAHNPLNPDLN